MSIQAVGWVLEHSQAHGVSRLVLLAVANHTSGSGKSWPGYDTIAREAHCSKRQAIRAVQTLTAMGELVMVKRGGPGRGHTNRYVIPGFSTGADEDDEKVTFEQEMVTFEAIKGVTVSPEPKEPKRTVASAHARGESCLVLRDDRRRCPTCSSSGMVLNDDLIAERCPDCNA